MKKKIRRAAVGENFDKYMKELWPAVLQRKSNHRLLTFILKDEDPLESSW